MILDRDAALKQISILFDKYPDLSILDASKDEIRVGGTILVYREVNDFTLRKKYPIEIGIPVNSDILPYVKNVDQTIHKSYPHLFTSGTLCLETEATLRFRFKDSFDLTAWMDEYVEPYFVTYEYYRLYGMFPNGERSHGALGILESYNDILHTSDIKDAHSIIMYIGKHRYRGHLDCPCGSGKRIRKCHGPYMWCFYENESLMQQLNKDIKTIEREKSE